ncbi:hypothetical protein BJY16_002013 [Actinoplanes octamycinicus]|uniref:Uncharacterized protein n=1 Tax=Actinoplanes octamycinicus TaxID=135948 RepID=A0A7W7GUI7_9ACTN|nr:hypothetical protein [Actinoplanes octamycinicus]
MPHASRCPSRVARLALPVSRCPSRVARLALPVSSWPPRLVRLARLVLSASPRPPNHPRCRDAARSITDPFSVRLAAPCQPGREVPACSGPRRGSCGSAVLRDARGCSRPHRASRSLQVHPPARPACLARACSPPALLCACLPCAACLAPAWPAPARSAPAWPAPARSAPARSAPARPAPARSAPALPGGAAFDQCGGTPRSLEGGLWTSPGCGKRGGDEWVWAGWRGALVTGTENRFAGGSGTVQAVRHGPEVGSSSGWGGGLETARR